MLSGEATNTNFNVFGLTRPGLEPIIYSTRGEHVQIEIGCQIFKYLYLWKITQLFLPLNCVRACIFLANNVSSCFAYAKIEKLIKYNILYKNRCRHRYISHLPHANSLYEFFFRKYHATEISKGDIFINMHLYSSSTMCRQNMVNLDCLAMEKLS